MWTENNKAISEVYTILKQMSEESLNKIPEKFLKELEKNATEECDYIKKEISLSEIELEVETKEILAVIAYNYFCNDEEREEWNRELEENERKYQKELREKYNPDNLFKDTSEDKKYKVVLEEQSLIEYKEPFYKKIINIIKKFLNWE